MMRFLQFFKSASLLLSAVSLILFNGISLKWPLIVSAPVVHQPVCLTCCVWWCVFSKQQYFSLTHEQYFSKLTCSNALILCPLFWRDYVWWCLQPLPSEKACAWFTTFGCVTVTDQNITPETSDEEQGYICQNVNICMPVPMFDVKVVRGKTCTLTKMSHPEPGMRMCSHQCEHV